MRQSNAFDGAAKAGVASNDIERRLGGEIHQSIGAFGECLLEPYEPVVEIAEEEVGQV
jgi:hypothetical protein